MSLFQTFARRLLERTPLVNDPTPDDGPSAEEIRKNALSALAWWNVLGLIIVLPVIGGLLLFIGCLIYGSFHQQHRDQEIVTLDPVKAAPIDRANYEYHRTHMPDYKDDPNMTEKEKEDEMEIDKRRLEKELKDVEWVEAQAAKAKGQ